MYYTWRTEYSHEADSSLAVPWGPRRLRHTGASPLLLESMSPLLEKPLSAISFIAETLSFA